MSQEDTSTQPAETAAAEEVSLFDQNEGVDWYLAWTISFADVFRMEQGITLSIGGLLITGTLISGREYFKEVAQMMAGATVHMRDDKNGSGKTVAQGVADGIRRFSEIYPEPDGKTDLVSQKPAFIHLRDAQYLTPDGPAQLRVPLWRGKLSSVDAFTIGTVTSAT